MFFFVLCWVLTNPTPLPDQVLLLSGDGRVACTATLGLVVLGSQEKTASSDVCQIHTGSALATALPLQQNNTSVTLADRVRTAHTLRSMPY